MPTKWTCAIRYSQASVVTIIISQAVLTLTFGFGHLPARTSNILACIVATGPSYYLNRNWAWSRRGKSSIWKEVVPFWALAFLGLAISTWATNAASAFARQSNVSQLAATMIVALAALGAFGTLWIGKFVLFNTVLFTNHPDSQPLILPTNATTRADPEGMP
jgi:putative flippase GtrA